MRYQSVVAPAMRQTVNSSGFTHDVAQQRTLNVNAQGMANAVDTLLQNELAIG